MLRWKSSLKPAAASGGGTNPGTSNLVAWLGMEEGSGNSVDDSTSNNKDFTKTNGSWVTGKVGNYAVRLDGNGDYMDSDANFAVGANVCTVSFWMYWTDTGSDEKFIYELGNRWWQNDGSIAFSWVQNESVFKVSMHDGSGNLEVKFPEPSSGQWVYVTVVHNGPGGSSNAGEIKLYYDGTAQSYSSYSSTKDQASNIGQAGSLFYIGANSANAQEITIDVDTFAVFSDELTQDEITWMYNSGNGRSYSDVSGAASYVLEQNFDASGTPTDFSVSQGSVNFNATPPTLSFQGGGTLYTADRYNNATISQATQYVYFQLYVDSFGEGSTNIFTIKTTSTDYRVRAKLYSTGVVRFESPFTGSSYVDLTKKYIAGAWYHFWMSYNPSTGAASLEFNATGTPSGSGDGYATLTLGTTTDSLSQIEINGRRSANMYMDRVLLNNSAIGTQSSFSQNPVVIPQLDATQDNGNSFSNNLPKKFNAADMCFSTGSDHSRAITVSKVEVQLKKTGTPTGALTCYLYEPATPTSEGVPDDRVGTADAVLSMSSISDSDYATYSFTFTGQSELAAGRWLHVVLYASDSTGLDGSNYIEWAGDSFIAGSWSMQQRTNGAPSATNDASNWTNQIDGNGGFYIKVYQSP